MPDVTTVRISGAGMPDGEVGPPLLAPEGPQIALGVVPELVDPVAPSPVAMFGPRGATLFSEDGPLWVCDTGHHRLLGWLRRPTRDGQPADVVIGQRDMVTEGRNGNGPPGAATLNVPTGVAPAGLGIAVADSWNHRILIWADMPSSSGAPATLVLGQASFDEGDPNRGGAPGPSTMHWPSRVMVHDGRLYVCDTGNRRVLVWRKVPVTSGAPADFALGQDGLSSRDDNGGASAGPSGLRWPHDLAIWRGNLVVADAGDNRVLVWDGIPDAPNAPARWCLGQRDFATVDHNGGRYWPDASVVNMPYGLAARGDLLAVADTASSRLLGWDFADLPAGGGAGVRARSLTGQPHFGAKGDNRFGLPSRDSLCWPYGVTLQGDTAVVSDTGNHRILLWRLA